MFTNMCFLAHGEDVGEDEFFDPDLDPPDSLAEFFNIDSDPNLLEVYAAETNAATHIPVCLTPFGSASKPRTFGCGHNCLPQARLPLLATLDQELPASHLLDPGNLPDHPTIAPLDLTRLPLTNFN